MAASLKIDSETRDRLYESFSRLNHIQAYNELTKYSRLEKNEKVKRWPEVWYAICFMQSDYRMKLLALFEAHAVWKQQDGEMYKKVAELQKNRAEYDARIKPFRAHETDWKCPYPECEQKIQDWEDIYPSCTHSGNEQNCGFHNSCLLKAADELKAAAESHRTAKKKNYRVEENQHQTPQKHKSAKNYIEVPPYLKRKTVRRGEWDVSSGDDTGESGSEESETEGSDTGGRQNKRVKRNPTTPFEGDDGSGHRSKFDPKGFPGLRNLPKMGGRRERRNRENDKYSNQSH